MGDFPLEALDQPPPPLLDVSAVRLMLKLMLMPRLMPMLTTTAVLLDMVRLTAPLLMTTLWLLTLILLGITMGSPTDTTMALTMLLLLLLLLPLWLKLLQLSRLLQLLKLPLFFTTQPPSSIMQLPLSTMLPLLLRLYPSQLPTPTLEPTLSSQPLSSRLSQSWLEDKQARFHNVLLLLLKIELLYNIIKKKRHQKNIKIHNTTITERIKSQNLDRGVAK